MTQHYCFHKNPVHIKYKSIKVQNYVIRNDWVRCVVIECLCDTHTHTMNSLETGD